MNRNHWPFALAMTALAFPAGAKSVEEIFRTEDTDRNGALSAAEARVGMRSEFRRIDADGNGSASLSEIARNIVANAPAGTVIPDSVLASMSKQTHSWWDDNKNGTVTMQEFQNVSLRLLMHADADGNGSVTAAELRKYRREPAVPAR